MEIPQHYTHHGQYGTPIVDRLVSLLNQKCNANLPTPKDRRIKCRKAYGSRAEGVSVLCTLRDGHSNDVRVILDERTFPELTDDLCDDGIKKVSELLGFLEAYIPD